MVRPTATMVPAYTGNKSLCLPKKAKQDNTKTQKKAVSGSGHHQPTAAGLGCGGAPRGAGTGAAGPGGIQGVIPSAAVPRTRPPGPCRGQRAPCRPGRPPGAREGPEPPRLPQRGRARPPPHSPWPPPGPRPLSASDGWAELAEGRGWLLGRGPRRTAATGCRKAGRSGSSDRPAGAGPGAEVAAGRGRPENGGSEAGPGAGAAPAG